MTLCCSAPPLFFSAGGPPFRFLGFFCQLNCPHPELLDLLRLDGSLRQSTASSCLFTKIFSITHQRPRGGSNAEG
jgi:hypothetical protein